MAASLYERLGKNEGITQIVEDAVNEHLSNASVKTRFENASDLEHAKKMSVEFFCAGSGGPEPYTGKDLITAHKGMNISEQEYLAVMDDILVALNKNQIPEETQKDVLAILYSLKEQVIRV